MGERLQLFPQDGVAGGQAEGLNDHQGDDGGGPHLNQIARDGGEGHHPVLIDHGLGQVVSADLDGAGQQQGQQIEGEGLFLLGDRPHHKAHAADNHQGEGGPQGPAGEQIKQRHADAPGDHAGALAKENGGHEEGDVPQMDEPAIGGER